MWLIAFLFLFLAVVGGTVEPTQNVSISLPSHTKTSSKRPFYVLAHMVNSLPEIDHYLALGANGIETDVYFAPNATPVFTFHGYPCDCFRHCGEKTKIEVFLNRIRELTTPTSPHFNPRFTLIFLDLKLIRVPHSAKALAGQNFAQTLLTNLFNETEERNSEKGSRVKMVISIAHVFDYDFVLGFQSEVEDRGKAWLSRDYVGWDVGMNDPLFAIESMWKRLDVVHNIWQGDGRSNCLSPFYNLGRLSSIVKRRDGPSNMFGVKNYIRKVYQWTVDLTVNIRTALRANVDAIITNHPERVLHVLKEREFVNRYRLASKSDSPFDRVWTKPARPSTTIRTPTLGLKLVNGAGDMFDSLAKFVGDIIKYKTPVRYFFLSTYAAQQHRRAQLREQLSEDPANPPLELIHQPLKESQQSGSSDELITLVAALWTRYRQPILDLLHFLLSR